MKVIEYVVDNETIEEFRKVLFIGKNKVDINDKKFIKAFDNNNNLITIAMITLPSIENVNNIIEKDLHYLIEDNYIQEINYLHENLDNGIYLNAIYSFEKNKGGAKAIIDYLENKYNNIWIYSWFEAEDYWDKLGWKLLEEHVYINKY